MRREASNAENWEELFPQTANTETQERSLFDNPEEGEETEGIIDKTLPEF